MTSRDDMKRSAALAALDERPREGVIGLGSGTTTFMFLEAVGDAVRAGRCLSGVARSEATRTARVAATACGVAFVDDRLENGQAARRAGIHSLHYREPSQLCGG